MKRKLLFAALLFCLAASSASSQAPAARAPFAEFNREVRQRAGFDGDKSYLSRFFNKERRRLGGRFEAELLRYTRGDAEKHYWLSLFLTEPSYLHGSKPLPLLALRLQQRGLDLLRGKEDQDSVGLSVSLNIVAAVLSAKLNLSQRAISYKSAAEELLAQDPDLRGFVPAISKEERKLYDSVASPRQPGRTATELDGVPAAHVSAGILNHRAKKLPPPSPPSMGVLRVDSEVRVAVVVDETGKVISARAVEGHPLLRAAAVEAARRAEFEPLLLSGKPVRFSGSLIYKFTHSP